jgi:hypothetical protein
VCFLAKQKGDTPTEHTTHILVKGDVPIERASCILLKGDACCGGASPFYLICKKSPTDYSPRECSLRQHAGCPLARIHQTYLCQRSPSGPAQEAPCGAQLSEIFELFRLARVLELVSITSSRRGGTKLLYHVVHV